MCGWGLYDIGKAASVECVVVAGWDVVGVVVVVVTDMGTRSALQCPLLKTLAK